MMDQKQQMSWSLQVRELQLLRDQILLWSLRVGNPQLYVSPWKCSPSHWQARLCCVRHYLNVCEGATKTSLPSNYPDIR